jgi:plasmid maintenance system antidote protein VapI
VKPVKSGDKLTLGNTSITFLHTPGHTPGSQCFLVNEQLLSGDTLFLGTCGRCDLPGSNPSDMYDSLNRVIGQLHRPPQFCTPATIIQPKDTKGTLADEKKTNRFLTAHRLEDFLHLVGYNRMVLDKCDVRYTLRCDELFVHKGLERDPLTDRAHTPRMILADVSRRLGISRKLCPPLSMKALRYPLKRHLRLAKAFDTSPELWLNLQQTFDLWNIAHATHDWEKVRVFDLAARRSIRPPRRA